MSKKGSSGGGGGGGRRRSSGGGGYSGSTTGGGMPITREDYNNILNKNTKKETYGPPQSAAGLIKTIAKNAVRKAKK